MSSSSRFTGEGVRDYERRRYRGWDQRLVHARERSIIRKLLRKAGTGETAGPPCLDIPCGYGRFTALLRGSGRIVVGADLSLEMARRAALNSEVVPPGAGRPDLPLRMPAVAAQAGRLPFRDGAFGLVVSIRFFHHVHTPEDRAAILGEFRRVAAGRGYVLASFYRANGLHAVQRRLRRLFGKSRTGIQMVERGVFEEAVGAAGFEIVRIVPLFRGIHAYRLALLRAPVRNGSGDRP